MQVDAPELTDGNNSETLQASGKIVHEATFCLDDAGFQHLRIVFTDGTCIHCWEESPAGDLEMNYG